ncbi:MAG: type II toxin-antitoxin system VapC family toxin [Beijerinckiaceae bacterium]|nr:type II toxin-antitoxin system VapC family toxin [Beijerinckiaceae bacterium]
MAKRVQHEGAVVPGLFQLEIGNILLQAERKGRLRPSDVAIRLALLGELPIATDPETAGRAWRDVIALARSHALTTYDAAYLELALRKGAGLATRDKALAAAAKALGVAVSP